MENGLVYRNTGNGITIEKERAIKKKTRGL